MIKSFFVSLTQYHVIKAEFPLKQKIYTLKKKTKKKK